MSIELILGPMYASKTSTLIAKAERHQIAKKKCVIFKFKDDTRYTNEDKVATHNQRTFDAIPTDTDISKMKSVADQYHVVLIDEGQFFQGLVEFCDTLANEGKIVIVSALDSDFKRQPFGEIPQLISRAEYITKLKAVCTGCYQDASFTQRNTVYKGQLLIGGTEAYQAVCRQCYNDDQKFINKKIPATPIDAIIANNNI